MLDKLIAVAHRMLKSFVFMLILVLFFALLHRDKKVSRN